MFSARYGFIGYPLTIEIESGHNHRVHLGTCDYAVWTESSDTCIASKISPVINRREC